MSLRGRLGKLAGRIRRDSDFDAWYAARGADAPQALRQRLEEMGARLGHVSEGRGTDAYQEAFWRDWEAFKVRIEEESARRRQLAYMAWRKGWRC